MGGPACRLLPYEVSDGPRNMADDEALLASAEAGTASLRLYGWSEPTVSLGYFQPEAPARADPLLAGLRRVRRPTGGDALVHHHEVTYALALPAGADWQPRDRPWLRRMHGLVAAALAGLGVPVSSCEAGRMLGGVLCFLHQTPGDLLLAGHKVVGSAQRRRRGALLQHGGILLAASPFTPGLPGLRELSGASLTPGQVLAAVAEAFADETGWRLSPAGWSAAELGRIEALRAGKYAQDAWNRKR